MSDIVQLAFDAGAIFTPGSPINEKDLFAGRLDQIMAIMNAISQRGYHAVLYGERGVGKTSLSNVLSDLLKERKQSPLILRVNCDAGDNFSSLWRKAFQDISFKQQQPGMGFESKEIEKTIFLISSLPENLTPEDVRRTLTTLSQARPSVIVFDEFDRLRDSHPITLMADTIKNLSDSGVPATILLIGVADSIDDLVGEHQSIERALVQIPMPRMSEDEIKLIVHKGLGRLMMSISGAAVDELADYSQGLPYVTHILALNSTRAALNEGKKIVDTSHLRKGIKASLDQWQQSIKSSYYTATKSQQPGTIFREVLLACAFAKTDDLGFFPAAAVRAPLRIITNKEYEIPNFASHLKQFSEAGRGEMLKRIGEARRIRYRFTSPMVRPYLILKAYDDGILTHDMIRVIASVK